MNFEQVNAEQAMVIEFHRAFNCQVGSRPALLSFEEHELRWELIREELQELERAAAEGDLLKVADGIGDILYVAYGYATACGIDMTPVFAEIHRANMAKLGGGIREDGKVLKPTGWTGPDIARVLAEQA